MPQESTGTDYARPDGGVDPRDLARPEEPVARYYLGILLRRVWIIIPAVVISTTIGTVQAFRTPNQYRAFAEVQVERQTPRLLRMDNMIQDPVLWDPDFYGTQVELVRSRSVMEIALEEPSVKEMFAGSTGAVTPPHSFIGGIKGTIKAALGVSPGRPSEPWDMLRNSIQVNQVKGTHIIVIESVSTKAKHASDVVNAVAFAFEAYHRQQKVQLHGETFTTLQTEKEKEEAALDEALKRFQQFRETSQGIVLDGTSQQPVLVRLSKLNAELTDVELERINLNARIKVVQEVLSPGRDLLGDRARKAMSLPVVRDDAFLVAARNGLVQAEGELATLSETYGPSHPRYQAAQARVEMMKEQFKHALEQIIVADANRLKIIDDRDARLKEEYETQKKVALSEAKEAFTYARLQNEVDRHRKLVDVLVEGMRQMDFGADMARTRVQVVGKAAVPTQPISESRVRAAAMAFAFGLVLGIGLALFLEHLDDTVKTPEDLRERVGCPLLGFVAHVAVPRGDKTARVTYRASIVSSEPSSSIAEAFRSIRTSLFFSAPAGQVKTLTVTSAKPGEGKTTTASNLALAIAGSGKRTLLIDADFHRPMLHKVFGLDGEKGLTNVLVGEMDLRDARCAVSLDGQIVRNLDVMPAGAMSPNPSELLSSARMREVLAFVREAYDWVIVDTPPILYVSDASIVGAMTDGVILVVRSGMSNRSLLKRTKEHLEGVKARLIGSILTHVVVARLGRNYSYYYYHGYARYRRDYHRSYYARDKEEGGPGADQAKG